MNAWHGRQPRRAGWQLTCCLLGAGFAIAGCDRLPASAVTQIREGHQAYQQQNYAGAQQRLSSVIAAHPTQPDIAEAYYVRGLAALKRGQTEQARQDFLAGMRLVERPDLRALLQAQLGNLAYESGLYEAAVVRYQKAEPDLPERDPTNRILLRYGISLQRCGRFNDAKLVLADLLTRFPHGPVAADARRRAGWVGDHYAIQCGVYARQPNAQSTARQLRSKGVKASAWRETRNGSVRYVVRAGKYARRSDAERALPAIRRIIPDAFVVP
jgi:tetratricopeptide (TPR) repeat protein